MSSFPRSVVLHDVVRWRGATAAIAVVWLLAAASPLTALPVSESLARTVAQNTIRQHVVLFGSWGGAQFPRTAVIESIEVGAERLAYNVRVRPRGHVLVAADDEFSPVLLYSDSHAFDVSRIGDAGSLESWLIAEADHVHRTLRELARERAPGSRPDGWSESRPGRAWGRFSVPEARFAPVGRRSPGAAILQSAEPASTLDLSPQAVGIVGPLLTTDWEQGAPYDDYTPADTGCPHTLAGCVAIAAAQLMRYWNWPPSGTGSYSYQWNGQTLSANFDHPYDWANMPSRVGGGSTAAQVDAVARLVSDVGISVDMWYSCGGSGASVYNAALNALPIYFSYKPTRGEISRADYTAADFFGVIRQDLDAAPPRPVLFAITSVGRTAGHALVIDGYQSGTTDQVHLNLGWGTSYQGWYDITNNWSAGGYTWDASLQYVFPGIEPGSLAAPAPTTTGLQPSSVSAGSGAFTLTVAGSNFVPSSGVRWNGAARMTTYVSATELQAAILGSDLTASGTATVTVVTPAPGGGTSSPQTLIITAAAGTRVVPSDFTGDLKSDMLWRHATRGDIWLWPMDGAARTAENYVRTVGDTNWEIRGVADFDGNGKADTLWRNKATGMIYVWLMNGGALLAETYVGTADPAYDIVGTGDYDGDGKADILWRHLTIGELWVWRMDGATPLEQRFVATVAPAYDVVGSGDLNGDGAADVVWRHKTNGEVWVWISNGTPAPDRAFVAIVPDTGYKIVGVADYDGDGKADILWHHATTGEVWLWRMDGATRLAETWAGSVPDTGYRIVGSGDYNGDGKADILWHHATAGEVWVWLMNGPTRLSETFVGSVPDAGYRVVR
jgi:hypothetical protein